MSILHVDASLHIKVSRCSGVLPRKSGLVESLGHTIRPVTGYLGFLGKGLEGFLRTRIPDSESQLLEPAIERAVPV